MRRRRLELGPPVGYPVQFRVTGPDPAELRRMAGEVRQVMRDNPHSRNVSDSWGNLASRFGSMSTRTRRGCWV